MAGKRVFIVDDHPIVRRGLSTIVNDEPDLTVCGEASTVKEALSGMAKEKPDVVLLDLKLEGSWGLELLRQMHGRFEGVKALVCSVYEESAVAERVIRAGAQGFVSKNVEGAVIVQAIRDVLAGRIHLSSEASDLLLHRLTGSPQEQHNEEDPVRRLSDREIQVFSMIGEGRSMAEIAVELNISQRTVETYRDNIKNKLDLDSSSEVIRRAAQWLVME